MQSRFKKISCEMESKKERIHIKTLILANEVKTLGYWKEKEKEEEEEEEEKEKRKKKKEGEEKKRNKDQHHGFSCSHEPQY